MFLLVIPTSSSACFIFIHAPISSHFPVRTTYVYTFHKVEGQEENENLLNNGEEKSDCDGYVNYHEIAYARCLLEIPEFEIMTTAQQDFHLGLMLKRISRGE